MTDKDFVPLNGFPNYLINKLGEIKNTRLNKIKKVGVGKRGYPVVSLRIGKKQFLRTVHILLARTFLPNPEMLPQVNHIDGNKLNYRLSNLEWCTARENNLHARRTGLHTSDGDKRVSQIKGDKIIAVYRSVSEASRQTGINRANIANVARGYITKKGLHLLTAGGFKWRYVNE